MTEAPLRVTYFQNCKDCLEAGGWHVKTLLWNKVSWTAGEKQIENFWWMRASYVIKLPEQTLCLEAWLVVHSTVQCIGGI